MSKQALVVNIQLFCRSLCFQGTGSARFAGGLQTPPSPWQHHPAVTFSTPPAFARRSARSGALGSRFVWPPVLGKSLAGLAGAPDIKARRGLAPSLFFARLGPFDLRRDAGCHGLGWAAALLLWGCLGLPLMQADGGLQRPLASACVCLCKDSFWNCLCKRGQRTPKTISIVRRTLLEAISDTFLLGMAGDSYPDAPRSYFFSPCQQAIPTHDRQSVARTLLLNSKADVFDPEGLVMEAQAWAFLVAARTTF